MYDSEIFNARFYTVFRKDRDFVATNTTKGGGVLLAVNSRFKALQIDLYSICPDLGELVSIEIVMCQIKGNRLQI